MSRASRGFDRLARWYRALEFIAFGRDLERARFAFLERLSDRQSILILGEGDGRCAARLLPIAPGARITCVDSSRGMIARAEARIREAGGCDRVSFECADARGFSPQPGQYDAVVTLFLLDCFKADEVSVIVGRVSAALRTGAPWVFADFTLPRRGIARIRARAWLALLYAFFRWETALGATSLPPSEEILEQAGWRRAETRDLQWGLLRSSVYRRPH
jgi:cyclopropane fatty-acyl-phospholipid synthase-like methyltransferase